MISAPRTLRTHSAIVNSRPARNTNWAGVVGKTGPTIGTPPCGRRDEPAVDEADEQDEQADADADRALEGERHGVHDGFAEADDDEQRDDEAFEDDDAHRARPASGRAPVSEKATMPLIPRPAARASG